MGPGVTVVIGVGSRSGLAQFETTLRGHSIPPAGGVAYIDLGGGM